TFESQFTLDPPVDPLRRTLGGLHAEPMQEITFAVVAVLVPAGDELRRPIATGHDLERDDIQRLAVRQRPEILRQAQELPPFLPWQREALDLAGRLGGVEHHAVVVITTRGEVSVDRLRPQPALGAGFERVPLEPRLELGTD